MIKAIICKLFHQPKYGWCSWTRSDGKHARCRCLKCGHRYSIRLPR